MWENDLDDGTIKTFSFQRSYKDDKGDWHQTQSMRMVDLPRMRVLIEEAYKDNTLQV